MRPIRSGPPTLALLLAGALLAQTPGLARAGFTYATFGAKAVVVDPEHDGGAFAFGVHAEMGKPRTNFIMLPGIVYWNSDRMSDLNANFDAYYHVTGLTPLVPFVGAGVGTHLLHFDGDDTNLHLGANLLAGVRIPGPGVDWLIEGRYTSVEVSHFGVHVGLTLRRGDDEYSDPSRWD